MKIALFCLEAQPGRFRSFAYPVRALRFHAVAGFRDVSDRGLTREEEGRCRWPPPFSDRDKRIVTRPSLSMNAHESL